jgi:hypothetical protein
VYKRENKPANQRARQAMEGQGEDRGYEHQWVGKREKRWVDREPGRREKARERSQGAEQQWGG